MKEGDVIGLCSENRLEFPIVVFATICLGATLAPLNVTYTDRKRTFYFLFWNSKSCNILINFIIFIFIGEFDHAINLSKPKLIFVSQVIANRAVKIAEKNSFVQKVIAFDTFQNNAKTKSKLATTINEIISTVKVSDFFLSISFMQLLRHSEF